MAVEREEIEEELEEAEEKPFNYAYFRRLMRYLIPYRKSLLVVGVFILMGTAVTLLEPYFLGLIVDIGVANKDVQYILMMIGVLEVFRLLA